MRRCGGLKIKIMRTKTIQLHPEIFNTARNLFGIENPDQKKLKQSVAISSTVENLKSTQEKQKDSRIFAVYPAIIEEAFTQTMDNYRKFVALKNFTFKEENHNINTYNNNVREYRKLNTSKCFEMQNNVDAFIKNRKSFSPVDYNDQVEKFNIEYGMLIRKKKLITIKPTAELVFQNFICIYNQQLMKKNQRYMSCNLTQSTPLEPFKVNAWRVTQLKRNGIQSLPLCKKTILNHRKRLEEFGVFVDYHFINSSHAVEVHINPEILVVKDIYNSKIAIAENQHVTSKSGKIVPNDNDTITRTLLNEVKNESKVENFPSDKEFATLTPFNLTFTRTPTRKEEVNYGAAPCTPVEVNTEQLAIYLQKNIDSTLLQTIVSDSEFAKQLENCEFNNYKPIDIRILHKVAYSGAVTRDQFFEIVMFDFLKSLQKNIYKTPGTYFGSWYNTIKLFRAQRWNLFNGEKFQPTNLVSEVTEYRWRIQWARNWYRKNPNVNPLFPNQYLDVTRKTSKEVGFEYTKSKWIDQQKENHKYDQLQKKQTIEAKKRGIAINHAKKCETQLNRFFKNKITLTQLYEYIENNLPSNFYQKLPDLIEMRYLKLNQKTIDIDDKIKYNALEF